ncbi:MAG TPA: four helix bundle protein [Candidatus Angelobacter sp.]
MSLDKHLELRDRTKRLAIRVVRMSRALPNNREANIISSQIIRSATGMAANYRAVGLARSKAEFVAKIGVVVEEADETLFWLEFLSEIGIIKPARLDSLRAEAKSLVAIFVASRKTAKS